MVEDISGWLRSVRPDTAADRDWTATPQADEILANVHRMIAPTDAGITSTVGSSRRPARRRRLGGWAWLPAGVLAAVVASVVTLAATSGTSRSTSPSAGVGGAVGAVGSPPGGGSAGTPRPVAPAMRPASMLLTSYPTCDGLLAGLRAHTSASVGPYGLPGVPSATYGVTMFATGAAGAGSPLSGTADSSAGVSASGTNDQEAGVDEPDIVKTDGARLITITDGVLRVVDDASHQITGTLDLTLYAGWRGAQLLVDGDHALVILGSDTGYAYASFGAPAFSPGVGTSTSLSTYLFVDLAGPPKVTGSLRASGSYLDARMVGSTARLVVSSSPAINFPAYSGTPAQAAAANRRAVAAAPLSAWLPHYTITDGSQTTSSTLPCSKLSHPAAYTGASVLTIYTLDLTHLTAATYPISVAADGNTVYATATSLYVASNPGWYSAPSAKQSTEIHRFDISGSTPPNYLGSAVIAGRLLSQYSLSDYAGSLRIATTLTTGTAASQSSAVFMLNDATLRVTGSVSGLGKGEQIYAVRFIGLMAYVVTFRQTDPLFVLDLRDPRAPKVAGSIALTGFSDYLHDGGDGRLIGVGQEASANGQVAGLQVSLFDVANPSAPARTGHVVVYDAPGESSFDPHSFLYWPATGVVAVPIQSWTAAESGKLLVLKVSGQMLTKVGLLANPRGPSSTDDQLGIQRSLIIDGALWTVSGSGVQVSNPATLSRQAWIPYG